MHKRIPLIARDLKHLYTGFLITALVLFIVCSWLTQFNPMTLIANGDAFWEFITEDFLPPALPKSSRIPGVLESVLVTLALALSSTTVAAILAFFVALFGSEKVSPFPKMAKFVRGFATFMRNIPALVWAFILFSSLGIGTGVGFIALCITSFAFFGACLRGNHRGCFSGLCRKPASGGRQFSSAGEPGNFAFLLERISLLVPLQR